MSNSTKPSFFEAVSSTVSEIMTSRNHEGTRGVDAVANTINNLGYLVSKTGSHDNLDMTAEARQAEINRLEADFAAPAAENIGATSLNTVEVASQRDIVDSTERAQLTDYEAEARRLLAEALSVDSQEAGRQLENA